MNRAKAWYRRARGLDGEFTAHEGVCNLVLGLCTPREHELAYIMAEKVEGLETEDILGVMAIIGWELCERS